MTLEKALNTEEGARKRPQATFKQDAPFIKVTFSKRKYTRRDPADEDADREFHIVYADLQDGTGLTDCGEAFLSSGEFDVEIFVTRSVQPYAFQVLKAAEQNFRTRNISIEYYD